jgi:hypothetical protein
MAFDYWKWAKIVDYAKWPNTVMDCHIGSLNSEYEMLREFISGEAKFS